MPHTEARCDGHFFAARRFGAGPSSPEEKLRPVADLVSSELQGMLKQHKAAPMGEQPGQGEELEMLVVGAPVIGR